MMDSIESTISMSTRLTTTPGRRWCSKYSWMEGHPHLVIHIPLSCMKIACMSSVATTVITGMTFTDLILRQANGARLTWRPTGETVYGQKVGTVHLLRFIKTWCFSSGVTTVPGNSTTSTASTSVMNNMLNWNRIAAETWTLVESVTNLLPCPRDSHILVNSGNSIFLFGGSTGNPRSDFYEFKIDESKWVAVSHKNGKPPTSRFCHVGLVFKKKFYIFGGYDGDSRLNDFHYFLIDDRTFEI